MNEAEKSYQEGIERGAEALAKEIDREIIESMLHAGNIMSDKGYKEASLKTPQFLESQRQYHKLWAKDKK